MRITSGSIPKTLFIGCLEKRGISSCLPHVNGTCEVFPAFCCDAENKKTVESVQKWAKGGEFFTVPNDVNFTQDTKIVNFEERGNGGHVWKIIIHYNGKSLLFDLRSIPLLEIIDSGKIEFGKIKSPLVWARVASDMKLITQNGEIHNSLSQLTERKKQKPINKNDLILNGIYLDSRGDRYIFAGNYHALEPLDEPVGRLSDFVGKIRVKRVIKQVWFDSPDQRDACGEHSVKEKKVFEYISMGKQPPLKLDGYEGFENTFWVRDLNYYISKVFGLNPCFIPSHWSRYIELVD